MTVVVRRATEADVEDIGRLAQEFGTYLRALGDPIESQLTSEKILRDGFGQNPAFEGLVGEVEGNVVGYLLYHYGYDADYAVRVMHIVDLFVGERYRSRGVGRALMDAARAICEKAGVGMMFWSVYKPNRIAHRFYRRLGAEYVDDLDFMRVTVGETSC